MEQPAPPVVPTPAAANPWAANPGLKERLAKSLEVKGLNNSLVDFLRQALDFPETARSAAGCTERCGHAPAGTRGLAPGSANKHDIMLLN